MARKLNLGLVAALAVAGIALANSARSDPMDQAGGAGAATAAGQGAATAAPAVAGGTAALPSQEAPSIAGAFERLSPGNQEIARALLERQRIGPEGEPAWSLDRIAAAKEAGLGWGRICKEMQALGLIQDRNLGEVVSRFRRDGRSATTRVEMVVTTAGGDRVIVGTKRLRYPAKAPPRGLGKGEGLTTAGGPDGTVAPGSGGLALGHAKSTALTTASGPDGTVALGSGGLALGQAKSTALTTAAGPGGTVAPGSGVVALRRAMGAGLTTASRPGRGFGKAPGKR